MSLLSRFIEDLAKPSSYIDRKYEVSPDLNNYYV